MKFREIKRKRRNYEYTDSIAMSTHFQSNPNLANTKYYMKPCIVLHKSTNKLNTETVIGTTGRKCKRTK